MSKSPRIIRIRDNEQKVAVDALLHQQLSEKQIVDSQKIWAPIRQMAILRMHQEEGVPKENLPKHYGWDWTRKISQLSSPLFAFYGIECEGEFQGLMKVSLEGHFGRLTAQKGQPLIYIDYIETAPWNIKILDPRPRFGGIGAQLVRAAIELSIAEGCKGRIGLHSLPGDQLGQPEWFYQTFCGMTPLGRDSQKEDLIYFEITSEDAKSFLGGK